MFLEINIGLQKKDINISVIMSVLKEYEDRVDKTFVLEEFIHSAK